MLGELKGSQRPDLFDMQASKTLFLIILIKSPNILNVKLQGKGRAFVAGSENLRLKPGVLA